MSDMRSGPEKILVTGAAGLIGYEVAEILKYRQAYPVFLAYHNCGSEKIQSGFRIDLERAGVESLKEDFGCIVHCAAVIPGAVHGDEAAAAANRRIDDNIIDYCVRHGCRLIYVSGSSVYDNDDQDLLTEESKLKLDSRYKEEKRNSEIRIEKECGSYCILRVSSPYGARQKNASVFKIFIDAVCEGSDICYFGSGSRTQDFIEVRDIARAVWKGIRHQGNGIFNIASGKPVSMRQLAELISKIGRDEFGMISKVCAGNRVDPQEDVRVNIGIHAAESVLGWKPQIGLAEGIREWLNVKRRCGEQTV